jgi:hypothetical protein
MLRTTRLRKLARATDYADTFQELEDMWSDITGEVSKYIEPAKKPTQPSFDVYYPSMYYSETEYDNKPEELFDHIIETAPPECISLDNPGYLSVKFATKKKHRGVELKVEYKFYVAVPEDHVRTLQLLGKVQTVLDPAHTRQVVMCNI